MVFGLRLIVEVSDLSKKCFRIFHLVHDVAQNPIVILCRHEGFRDSAQLLETLVKAHNPAVTVDHHNAVRRGLQGGPKDGNRLFASVFGLFAFQGFLLQFLDLLEQVVVCGFFSHFQKLVITQEKQNVVCRLL